MYYRDEGWRCGGRAGGRGPGGAEICTVYWDAIWGYSIRGRWVLQVHWWRAAPLARLSGRYGKGRPAGALTARAAPHRVSVGQAGRRTRSQHWPRAGAEARVATCQRIGAADYRAIACSPAYAARKCTGRSRGSTQCGEASAQIVIRRAAGAERPSGTRGGQRYVSVHHVKQLSPTKQ